MAHRVRVIFAESMSKLRSLLQVKRLYSASSMVRLFKCHMLSYIESNTPAIYHSAPSILRLLDSVQETLLMALGVGEVDAFLIHNLAPMSTRRDIAMLAVLHRIALGVAHGPIQRLFPQNSSTMYDHFSAHRQTQLQQQAAARLYRARPSCNSPAVLIWPRWGLQSPPAERRQCANLEVFQAEIGGKVTDHNEDGLGLHVLNHVTTLI